MKEHVVAASDGNKFILHILHFFLGGNIGATAEPSSDKP